MTTDASNIGNDNCGLEKLMVWLRINLIIRICGLNVGNNIYGT
jgi:hypothetical protein